MDAVVRYISEALQFMMSVFFTGINPRKKRQKC